MFVRFLRSSFLSCIDSAQVTCMQQGCYYSCTGRFFSTCSGKSSPKGTRSSRGIDFTLDPVEMEPISCTVNDPLLMKDSDTSHFHGSEKSSDLSRSGDVSHIKGRPGGDEEKRMEGVDEEPLAKDLENTVGYTPYRVSWYDYGRVSPAKRFTYWAYRRLRELPPEWQEYYRRMLYQELSASRYVNQTWDCFMMVVDGYNKGKWVLKKYGVPIDESLIPKPYNNFWEETTHEERVWAHRRSHQMKELQALQRDEDELLFGAHMMDRREVSYGSIKNLQTSMQGGTPVHAHDMPAPSEADVKMSQHAEEMSSALMSSIEDDKLWNPVLRSRLHTQRMREEAGLYGFEDEEEDARVN